MCMQGRGSSMDNWQAIQKVMEDYYQHQRALESAVRPKHRNMRGRVNLFGITPPLLNPFPEQYRCKVIELKPTK